MTVEWSVPAVQDLGDIEDFIALDNPERAETFVNELIECGDSLADEMTYQKGVPAPWANSYNIRELYYKKYTIVYEISDTEQKIYIHEVYNQAKITLHYGKRK